MIGAIYNWDESKSLMVIELQSRVKDTPEGYKQADTTFALENSIGKHYSETKEKSGIKVDIFLATDNQYLWAVAHMLKNYCRGIYNQMEVNIFVKR